MVTRLEAGHPGGASFLLMVGTRNFSLFKNVQKSCGRLQPPVQLSKETRVS
jgi:hypothetical protein